MCVSVAWHLGLNVLITLITTISIAIVAKTTTTTTMLGGSGCAVQVWQSQGSRSHLANFFPGH